MMQKVYNNGKTVYTYISIFTYIYIYNCSPLVTSTCLRFYVWQTLPLTASYSLLMAVSRCGLRSVVLHTGRAQFNYILVSVYSVRCNELSLAGIVDRRCSLTNNFPFRPVSSSVSRRGSTNYSRPGACAGEGEIFVGTKFFRNF